MAKLAWEQVERGDDGSHIVTWRTKVPGGWLVSVWARTEDGGVGPDVEGGSSWGGGVTFMPDPLHTWDVEIRRAR